MRVRAGTGSALKIGCRDCLKVSLERGAGSARGSGKLRAGESAGQSWRAGKGRPLLNLSPSLIENRTTSQTLIKNISDFN